jgi:hypothetical protein
LHFFSLGVIIGVGSICSDLVQQQELYESKGPIRIYIGERRERGPDLGGEKLILENTHFLLSVP